MTNTPVPNDERTTTTRRLPLRFSLRFLLLAVTAFAIGFPIWYRWPYEVCDDRTNSQAILRQTTTWQREWGGKKTKRAQSRYLGDRRIGLQSYRGDVLDGPWERLEKDGAREVGQYASGKKDGLWRRLDSSDNAVLTATWRNGVLDGPYEFPRHDGKKVPCVFERGRLTSVNGKRHSLFTDAMAKQGTGPASSSQWFEQPLHFELVDTPLDDAISLAAIATNSTGDPFTSLQAAPSIPILIDSHHADGKTTVRVVLEGMQRASALTVLALYVGLDCDYRYGCVWITSAESKRTWRDPTGVAEIVPPENSRLSQAWSEPVRSSANPLPLDQAVTSMTALLQISVDTSRVAPANIAAPGCPAKYALSWLPLKDALGVLLYQTRCRCKLEGETLVILQPE